MHDRGYETIGRPSSRGLVTFVALLTALFALALMAAAAFGAGNGDSIARAALVVGAVSLVSTTLPALVQLLAVDRGRRDAGSASMARSSPVIVVGHRSRTVEVLLSGPDLSVRVGGTEVPPRSSVPDMMRQASPADV